MQKNTKIITQKDLYITLKQELDEISEKMDMNNILELNDKYTFAKIDLILDELISKEEVKENEI